MALFLWREIYSTVDFVVISGQGHVSGINNGVEKGKGGRLIGRCEKSRPSETE